MISLATLEAFIREHESRGAPDTGVDDDRVWITWHVRGSGQSGDGARHLGEARPMNVLRAIATLAGAITIGACTTVHNTPQQDLVWSAYNQCKAEGRISANLQMVRVEPDGRAWYSANRSTYGTQELQSCLKEKTSSSSITVPPPALAPDVAR